MSAAPAKPRSTQPLTPGRVVGERYVVQRVLGQGGMGQVVEVEHVGLGRRFALKVLRLERWNDELVRRFNREARALAKLTTPRVAQVTDFGVDEEGGPFYVMELLEGETLEQRLDRQKTVAPREALTICAELCDALTEVHEAGIVHRDLKPSNVGLPTVGPVGVKLLDFGLAAAMDDAFLSRITQSQQILGSLPYMAPEQFNGAEPHPSMDVYAVGIVLYESLVGRLPFLAPSTAALIHQILSTPFPALPGDLSRLGPIEPLLERLLAKEPAQRFASAAAAGQALRQAATALGGPMISRGPHPVTRVATDAERGGPAAPNQTVAARPGAVQKASAVPRANPLPPTVAASATPAPGPMPPTVEARAVESDRLGHLPTMMAEAAQNVPVESGMRLSQHAQAPQAHMPPTQDYSALPAAGYAPPSDGSYPHPMPPHPSSWQQPVTHSSAGYAAPAPSGSGAMKIVALIGIGLLLFGLTGVAVAVGLSLIDDRDAVADEDDTPPPPRVGGDEGAAPVATGVAPPIVAGAESGSETETETETETESESGAGAGTGAGTGAGAGAESGGDGREDAVAHGVRSGGGSSHGNRSGRRSDPEEAPDLTPTIRPLGPDPGSSRLPTTTSPSRGNGTWNGNAPSREW